MLRLHAAVLAQAVLILCLASAAAEEAPLALSEPTPGVNEIVERMQQHDARQMKALKHYQAIRHYQVQYAGAGISIAGKMDVEIIFDSASGKSFRILSQSGSKLLCDKVLKRAVESEQEASQSKVPTGLTPANYHFELLGTEPLNGRLTYVLKVNPWHESKFLYRGKVWVDAKEFAVARVEAEPAKNPSIWISRTLIEFTTSKTEGVWLPDKNRSESKIRIGGTAVLSIDYGAYRVALDESRQDTAKRPIRLDRAATEEAF